METLSPVDAEIIIEINFARTLKLLNNGEYLATTKYKKKKKIKSFKRNSNMTSRKMIG
jgi:hypothetical protein